MSITCKFQLTRTSNIYYGGEDVTGTVTLCSLKQRQVESIILEFYGQSKVEWWELDKSSATDNIMHNDISTQEVTKDVAKTLYSNQQKHVCCKQKLDYQHLRANVEYTFQFCFQIPEDAPATCCCTYGKTEYGIRLQVQHIKKVNKEFHQRIVVKNKLDLRQEIQLQQPLCVSEQNTFGQIKLYVPCTGFTPGQKIPYHFTYQTTQANCKLLIHLNCLITCRSRYNCNKFKQIKQIVNSKKHLLSEAAANVNIPLDCQISSANNDDDLILKWEYSLSAILISGTKRPLLSVTLPITVGTIPCFRFDDMDKKGLKNYMCFDNYGSSSLELANSNSGPGIVDLSQSMADQICESLWILPIKRKTHLRKSLRYCYKKLIKLM